MQISSCNKTRLQLQMSELPWGLVVIWAVWVLTSDLVVGYKQGYHFVLISKICAYFQGQCLRKRECAYF